MRTAASGLLIAGLVMLILSWVPHILGLDDTEMLYSGVRVTLIGLALWHLTDREAQ